MPSIGKYNKDNKKYAKLVRDLYQEYKGGVWLPPEYASFVDNNLLRFLIRLSRYKFAARLLRDTDCVLEVGCGSGLGTIFLAQYCKDIVGLDVKVSDIKEAKKLNKRNNITFIVKDLFNLSVDNRYDAVVALDVIEHMNEDNGKRLVAEMAKHIKKNGMLILGTPSIYSYPYQGPLSRASHVKCYDQRELATLMGKYFGRVLSFSMNDEVLHTGHPKMSWYYMMVAFYPL